MYSLSLQQMADVYRARGDEAAYLELMESATLSFYSSQLIALEDLERCEDQTGGLVYRNNWGGERAKVVSEFFASRSAADRERIRSIVMTFAANRDSREPDLAACGSGIEVMRKSLEAGRCHEAEKWETTHLPGNAIACNGEEFAEVVSDEIWQGRRAELRDVFREYLGSIGG